MIDKLTEIERDNRLLLEKISNIMVNNNNSAERQQTSNIQ